MSNVINVRQKPFGNFNVTRMKQKYIYGSIQHSPALGTEISAVLKSCSSSFFLGGEKSKDLYSTMPEPDKSSCFIFSEVCQDNDLPRPSFLDLGVLTFM